MRRSTVLWLTSLSGSFRFLRSSSSSTSTRSRMSLRVGSERAHLGQPEVSVGIIPGAGGTQRLPRLVGPAVGAELCVTGRIVAAEEALRIGLLNRIVEGDPLEAAIQYARAFSGNGLLALRLVRDAALRGRDTSLREGLRIEADLTTISMRSDDGREGARAFLEKRAAVFKDR